MKSGKVRDYLKYREEISKELSPGVKYESKRSSNSKKPGLQRNI